MDPDSRSAADGELPVRALIALALLLGAAPAAAQSQRIAFICTAGASGAAAGSGRAKPEREPGGGPISMTIGAYEP